MFFILDTYIPGHLHKLPENNLYWDTMIIYITSLITNQKFGAKKNYNT